MTKTLSTFVIALSFLISMSLQADPLSEARTLFAKYAALEAAFDSNIADLYSDDALIKNKRIYPTGEMREIVIPAPKYKLLLRSAIPLAKAKGDYSTYSEIFFQVEHETVRITAKRYSVLKQYFSPITLLVAQSPSGAWLINQELSESQP